MLKTKGYVYLTESARSLVASELGQRVVDWPESAPNGRLQVWQWSHTDGGWIQIYAFPTEPHDKNEMIMLELPPHAVAGIVYVRTS